MLRPKRIGILLLLFGILLLAALVATSIGAAQIPLSLVGKIFLRKLPLLNQFARGANFSPTYETIIFEVRLPRVILSAIVGAALATAGVIFQGLFKNPMADPYIIGVSSGAALGATLAIVLQTGTGLLGFYAVPLMAFLGAMVTTLIVYRLAKVGGRIPISSLLLAGLAVGSFLTAIISFIMASTGKDIQAVIFWLMGGFSARNWSHVKMVLPFFLLGLPIALAFVRDLNIMLLGEEKAQHLGVEIEQVKKVLLVSASLMAAAAVSISGLIGFVGLMIPHIVRLILGPDHRLLLPCSALAGAIFLIVADTMARVLLAPTEIPVGIITAFFGAPFFIYLLRIKRKALI